MIRATVHATKPDEIECTLELTMTLGEWRRLHEQLDAGSHPSFRIRDLVRKLISQTAAHFQGTLAEDG